MTLPDGVLVDLACLGPREDHQEGLTLVSSGSLQRIVACPFSMSYLEHSSRESVHSLRTYSGLSLWSYTTNVTLRLIGRLLPNEALFMFLFLICYMMFGPSPGSERGFV